MHLILTLLARIHDFVSTSSLTLVDIPVALIIRWTRIRTRLDATSHLMAVWCTPVGVDDMLECRMLSLLALHQQHVQHDKL